MAKKKNPKSRAEREAWDAHVDETLRKLRAAIASILARDARAASRQRPL
jgi:hypothetical protein